MSSGNRILYGIFLFIPLTMIVLIEVEIFSNVDLGNHGGILKALQRSPEGTMGRILLCMGIGFLSNLADCPLQTQPGPQELRIIAS